MQAQPWERELSKMQLPWDAQGKQGICSLTLRAGAPRSPAALPHPSGAGTSAGLRETRSDSESKAGVIPGRARTWHPACLPGGLSCPPAD